MVSDLQVLVDGKVRTYDDVDTFKVKHKGTDLKDDILVVDGTRAAEGHVDVLSGE